MVTIRIFIGRLMIVTFNGKFEGMKASLADIAHAYDVGYTLEMLEDPSVTN